MAFPFKRILVPVDFDDNSKSALDLAQELAAIVDGSLHVLHVIAILLAPGESASFVATREEEVRAAIEGLIEEEFQSIQVSSFCCGEDVEFFKALLLLVFLHSPPKYTSFYHSYNYRVEFGYFAIADLTPDG